MPRTIEKTVYQFAELSERAKERARDWYRSGDEFDFSAEYIIEDAKNIAALFGLEFDSRQVPLMNGKTRGEPCVYYSGFCSQGDGASFTGRYAYVKGAAKKVKEYSPKDERLHLIVDGLQALQRANFYQLVAKITARSNYYSHSGTMQADVYRKSDDNAISSDVESDLLELMRDFADWLYRQLEKENEYTQSDDYVDENINANEYEFTEEGERV